MNAYKFVSNVRDDDKLREAFWKLPKDVFGIDFEPWYKAGHWDNSYIPYSLMDGDTMIANVSANEMTILIDGQRKRVIQIGTVCTNHIHRGQGAGRFLMEKVMEIYRGIPMYLLANGTVLDFYTKFGFVRGPQESEAAYTVQNPSIKNIVSWQKVSLTSDIVKNLLKKRAVYSPTFDISHNLGIDYFYLLYFYSENIYYHEQLDLIAVITQNDDHMTIHDLCAAKRPDSTHLLSSLLEFGAKKFLYTFAPDGFGLPFIWKESTIEDSTLFVTDNFPVLPKEFVFSEFTHA